MAEKVNLQQKIQAYRQSHPKLKKLSDEQILSIMIKNDVITLTAEQKQSILGNSKTHNQNTGLKVEKTTKKPTPKKTIYLQSGRKVVYFNLANGKIGMKYYGADGTPIKPDYFKKVEGNISISADGKSYTITKNGKKITLNAKNPDKGAIDQNLVRLNNEEKRLNKAKKEQGLIGKGWDWLKNQTGIGDGSDKAQQQINAERKLLNQIKTGKIDKKDFKTATGLDYSKENLARFKRGELSQASAKINGYKEGQDMAVDVVGDIVSGIAAVGIYTTAVAAAPFTGGASIAVGVAAAAASGALIKAGVKALDTVGTDKKYTMEDLKHDLATGAFSGVLAPITGGLGGAAGKAVATKLGVQAVKEVGKDVAKETAKGGLKSTLKTALVNPTGYEYVGGTVTRRTTAMAAEMATDGTLGGAIDGGFRAGLDNNWDTEAMLDGTIEGGIGGATMSPLIGGGFKLVGKGAQKAFRKNNVKIDAQGNKVGENTPSKIETAPSKTELETNVSDKIKSEQSQIGGKEVNTEVGKSANPEQPQALNAEVKPEVKKQNAFVKLEIPETPVQTQQRLLKELETAKSRDDFRRITKEIKELPKTPEYQAVKERLGGEYFQRYNEWKADLPESTRAIKNMADEVNPKSTNNILKKENTVPLMKNSEVKLQKLTDKKFDETTIPKTKAILEEMGFTKEEISSIDLKNSTIQQVIEGYNNALKYTPELKTELGKVELLDFLKGSKEEIEGLFEEIKFFTDDNCKFLAKHVIFDDDGKLINIFTDYNNPQVIMELLPVLTQNGKHKLLGSELHILGYFLDKPNNVAKITPENVDFMYKINEKIENKNFALKLCDILDFENTTSEFADNYIKEANRFAKFGIEDVSTNNLSKRINKRKAVSDFLEEYPIDVTTYDYMNEQNAKLSGFDVYQLSQYSNKAEVQKFVNSLTKEARTQYCNCADFIDKGFPPEKLANFLNEVAKNNLDEIHNGIYNLLNKMVETDSKDYNSMIDLVMAYKGTKCLSWYGNEKFVQVANGDFKGAAKYVELAKELKMNSEYYKYLISDKNADFKMVEECLTYVKENKINIYEYSYLDNDILRNKNWKDSLEKFQYANDFMDKFDLDMPEFMVSNLIKNSLTLKDVNELYGFLQTDGWFNKRPNMIFRLLSDSNKDNLMLAEKLCADKNFPKEHIAQILGATNKDNLALSEKLCADNEFSKEFILTILRKVNSRNVQAVIDLCTMSKEYDLKEKTIYEMIPLLGDIKLGNLKLVKDKIEKNLYDNLSASDFVILTNSPEFIGKTSVESLLKSERHHLINLMLNMKSDICAGRFPKCKDVVPIFPNSKTEYSTRMRELSGSLNISIDKLTPERQAKFDSSIGSLSNGVKEMNLADLSEINLKYSQKEFINNINELLKDLPTEEQIKLQNKFGFRIIDNKLTGYPKTVKDINSVDFENKELLNKINEKVDSFLNNNALTVKDNPQLNSLLNDLFNNCPEILNQIDGTQEFAKTVKRLQTIVNCQDFKTLSDSDQKIIVLATLVENTDKSINTSKDTAFDAFFIGQKYGLSDNDAKKLYYIVEAGSNVETFMQTTKDETIRNYRGTVITGQDRQDKFDMMALNLKEDNRLKMAQMLYTSKYPEGFTRNFDKVLENRINEIKSQDFILPQTPSETYQNYAIATEISRGNNKYNVNVVNAKDIPNMYAFIHTPEAGYATGGTRAANFSNFEAFATLNDDKVICTSYVSADKAGLVREHHNGFIFEVQNDKQYVAYGRDICSLGKNIQDIVVEYYRDKGFKANQNKGDKYDHRTLMSNIMKQMLFGKNYYQISKDVVREIAKVKAKYLSKLYTLKTERENIIKNTFGTANITNAQYRELKSNVDFVNIEKQMKDLKNQELAEIENIPEYKELKEMDNKYIARLDNVKSKLGDKPMTLDNIREIDVELADAYKAFLDKDGANKTENDNSASLLRSSWHNEALVSNPKITGIFTDNIKTIPEEYLIKAQEENLPIVIFDVSE